MQFVSQISDLCGPKSPTSQTDGQTDGQTDRRTDGRTTCDDNTALCTKVHRAVKNLEKRERGRFQGLPNVFSTCKLPPIISETVKLRTSNVAGTFTGYTSEQNVI